MSYLRVVPRDLFNEGNLLKCYGKLYILTEGNPTARFVEEVVDSFDVVQRDDDGYLFVRNLPFRIGGDAYRLVRPLNARGSWPLYAELVGDSDFEAVAVFDNDGRLTPEMLDLIQNPRKAVVG